MARISERLTALRVQHLKAPGRHPDGGGLYLQITPSGGKSWIFRYRRNSRERQMGLGPLRFVTLAQAREKARVARSLLFEGQDPIERATLAPVVQTPSGVTFDEATRSYIDLNKTAWRNAKHAQQWRNTLNTYALPTLGAKRLGQIETADVVQVLRPIWLVKTETASRLRSRIEAILNWGTAHGYRQGENPARWRGHLEMIFPAKTRVAKVKNHPALPFEDLPAFMGALKMHTGVGAPALRFVILTAARIGEVLGADWREIDLDQRIWTIPAERMKAGKVHRVPLSDPAIEILQEQRRIWFATEARRYHTAREVGQPRPRGLVFVGSRPHRAVSASAISTLLRLPGLTGFTCHGFRSTFRDWASEETSASAEVVEMALAHTIANKVEAAYRRGDLLQKRRPLMDHWAVVCLGGPSAPGD